MPKIAEDTTVSANDLLKLLAAKHPFVIPIVGRKANIGNFENIDVALGVCMPVEWEGGFSKEQFGELKQAFSDAVEMGFEIASEETYARYLAIKEQLAGS